MSYFVLGCPSCSAALQVSMYRTPMETFACVACGASILLNRSMSLELSAEEYVHPLSKLFPKPEKPKNEDDPLLDLLVDAAGYGAFYQELSARDSSMGVAKDAQDSVKTDLKVRKQMAEWLKSYREDRP